MTPVARQKRFVLTARMLTWPLTILANTLVGVLLWIYLTDRGDNKEFQQEVRQEFKEVKEKAADFREDIKVKIATISSTCCTELRTKPDDDQLGERNEKKTSDVVSDAAGAGVKRMRAVELSCSQCAQTARASL